MSTATSTIPAAVDAPSGPRRGSSYSGPSRTQSTRARTTAAAPSPARTSSTYVRPPSSSRLAEVLPQRDYETTNVARSSSKRSSDRPPAVRAESSRSGPGHHRSSSKSNHHHHHHQPSEMPETPTAANGGGPIPVVTAIEGRHGGRQGKSRTTIPAQSGNWILGKTIGAGSMGKVKLARRAEGGEQVCRQLPSLGKDVLQRAKLIITRLPSKLSLADLRMRMGIIKAGQIVKEQSTRKKSAQRERLP